MISAPLIMSLSPLPKAALLNLMGPHLQGVPVNVVSVMEIPEETRYSLLQEPCVILGDFTFQRKIDDEWLSQAKQIRLIQQPSVGYQHIDVEACAKRGIPVANTAGANNISVAEHTFMLALSLLKKTLYFHQRTRDGHWAQMEAFDRGVFELAGKTWGIVGMGRIGMELARRLRAFDVTVYYTDLHRKTPEQEALLGIEYYPFDSLLPRVDILSLHAPLTPGTRHMLNDKTLKKMKTGAHLINVARGELVDEPALLQALKTKRLAGAGLDVFDAEPVSPDNLLLKLPNVVLSPHLAGTTNEARARIIQLSIQNIIRVVRGEKPINIVNGVET